MARTRRKRPEAPALDENTLNLRELAAFVEETGFRLGLATYDVPETREAFLKRLAEEVADWPVHLTRLDLTRSPHEEQLLRRLREHLRDNPAPEGKHPAVMVVGLEAAIDFGRTPDGLRARGGPLLHNANFQRDAFTDACPAPVVLWLSPYATTAFGQSAPDLWHWRSGSFAFTGAPEARSRIERELIATPVLAMSNLDPERKRARIGMLRDLLAELEVTEDRETPGNRARRAALLHEIGLTLLELSETTAAIEGSAEALELYRAIGDRFGEGSMLDSLGNAYAGQGQMGRALQAYEQSLTIAREVGDRRGEAITLCNLGNVYAGQGQMDRALVAHEQSLTIAREIGDRRGEGIALDRLGNEYADLRQMDRALQAHEQSLAIAREVGDRRSEGSALGNLGLDYLEQGQVDRALDACEQALAIAREVGDRCGEWAQLNNLGNAYHSLGQADRALDAYNQALGIVRAIGDRGGEGSVLGNLALTYADLGQPDRAIGLMNQALEIGQSIEDPRLIEFATDLLRQWQGEATAPPGPREGDGASSGATGGGA